MKSAYNELRLSTYAATCKPSIKHHVDWGQELDVCAASEIWRSRSDMTSLLNHAISDKFITPF